MTTASSSAPLFGNNPEVFDSMSADRLPSALEGEIRKIYQRSPLYTRRFALHSEPLHWSCYREIPTLSKKDIVENGHTSFFADYAEIERGLQEKRFEYESTSGTTSGPMTVIMEDGWWVAQTARAYRAHPLLAPFAEPPLPQVHPRSGRLLQQPLPVRGSSVSAPLF